MAIDPIMGIGAVAAGGGSVPYEGPYQFIYTTSVTWDTPATADYRFSVIGYGGTGSWAAGSGQGAYGVDSDWINLTKDTTFTYTQVPINPNNNAASNQGRWAGGSIALDVSNQTCNGVTSTRIGQMGGHGGSYYSAGQAGFGRYGGNGGNARTQPGYPYGGGGGGGHPYSGGGGKNGAPGAVIIEIDQTNDAFA